MQKACDSHAGTTSCLNDTRSAVQSRATDCESYPNLVAPETQLGELVIFLTLYWSSRMAAIVEMRSEQSYHDTFKNKGKVCLFKR